jgi:hypothetical protein
MKLRADLIRGMLPIVQFRLFCILSYYQHKVHNTENIFSPVILHWCETWFPTLTEKHRFMMFQYRVMRIFGPKCKGQEAEKCRIKKSYKFLLSFNISRVIRSGTKRWTDQVSCMRAKFLRYLIRKILRENPSCKIWTQVGV